MRMTGVSGGLGLAMVVGVALLGFEARAQSCVSMIDGMRSRSPGEYTVVSVTSSQANKLSSSAASVNASGFSTGAYLTWNGYEMSSFGSNGISGSLQYNDRNNPGYVTGAAQNFSTHAGQTDGFAISIFGDGTRVVIRNLVWNNTIVIENPICTDGIMYGFGTPVGNHNGTNPDGSVRKAMYVFSFTFMAQLS